MNFKARFHAEFPAIHSHKHKESVLNLMKDWRLVMLLKFRPGQDIRDQRPAVSTRNGKVGLLSDVVFLRLVERCYGSFHLHRLRQGTFRKHLLGRTVHTRRRPLFLSVSLWNVFIGLCGRYFCQVWTVSDLEKGGGWRLGVVTETARKILPQKKIWKSSEAVCKANNGYKYS